MISGAIVRNTGYCSGDQSLECLLGDNLTNLMSSFMNEHMNQKVDLTLHFIIPNGDSYRYISSRTYEGMIELNEDYEGEGLFLPDLLIRITGQMCVRPVAYENTLVLFSNFNRDYCEQFDAEYIEFDV